jgi:hypothetical protein
MKYASTAVLQGPSIQIDPTFPYYQNRTPESIAEEIELAGYRIVHYFVTNECNVDGALVEAFHDRGIAVWALTLGNGSFVTSHLPKDWPDWRMGLLKPVEDGYTRLSPFSYRYVTWKKETLARLVKSYPFDGLEIAEPYLPEWNGLETGVYGDVSPQAKAVFKNRYRQPVPEFVDNKSPYYYKKHPRLYADWVEFRVDGVNDYLDEIINGVRGVREVRPDIRIATWTLAVDEGDDSPARLREVQANDAVAMIGKVKPDLHYLQTHWPDWGKPGLPADYVRSYAPFVSAIRAAFPSLPIGIQTDIGSARQMIRDRSWVFAFSDQVNQMGCSTWTAYEYHLGGYMYDEPPRLLKTERLNRGEMVLSFHKRIEIEKKTGHESFCLVKNGERTALEPSGVRVDGNRLWISANKLPAEDFVLGVRHIRDTPEFWLFKESRANVIDDFVMAHVPASPLPPPRTAAVP